MYNECCDFNTMIYMYQGITIFTISEGLGKYCPKRLYRHIYFNKTIIIVPLYDYLWNISIAQKKLSVIKRRIFHHLYLVRLKSETNILWKFHQTTKMITTDRKVLSHIFFISHHIKNKQTDLRVKHCCRA